MSSDNISTSVLLNVLLSKHTDDGPKIGEWLGAHNSAVGFGRKLFVWEVVCPVAQCSRCVRGTGSLLSGKKRAGGKEARAQRQTASLASRRVSL